MTRHQDPAVAAASAALQETLDRMGAKMDEIEARHRKLGCGAPLIAVRVGPEALSGIAAYMRRHQLFNQAEAIRRLLAAGLAATEKENAA